MRTLGHIIFYGLLGMALIVAVVVCYRTTLLENSDLVHYDVLMVLGAPANDDGSPSFSQCWLVEEAKRELEAGAADHVIFSGGAVANRFEEAHVMAVYAYSVGIPAAAIFEDDSSRNTLENVRLSQRIMARNHWRSVEVIGLTEHLPRTAVLMGRTNLLWKMHPAQTPGRNWRDQRKHTLSEAVATTALRIFGVRAEPMVHWLRMRLHVT